jgi:hypothetical protein
VPALARLLRFDALRLRDDFCMGPSKMIRHLRRTTRGPVSDCTAGPIQGLSHAQQCSLCPRMPVVSAGISTMLPNCSESPAPQSRSGKGRRGTPALMRCSTVVHGVPHQQLPAHRPGSTETTAGLCRTLRGSGAAAQKSQPRNVVPNFPGHRNIKTFANIRAAPECPNKMCAALLAPPAAFPLRWPR